MINFKKKIHCNRHCSILFNCCPAVLCIFINIFNDLTGASKLVFAILLFFQLCESLLLQQFVLVTDFLPHHLWVDKVEERSANVTVVVGNFRNLRNTCQKVLLVTCTSCNVPFAAVSPTLQLDYLVSHFIVPPTLNCIVVRRHIAVSPTFQLDYSHCSTNAEFSHCGFIDLVKFDRHILICGQLTSSYLDSFVCLRGSQVTSLSHLNLGDLRVPERY